MRLVVWQVYERGGKLTGGEGTLLSLFPNGCKSLNQADPSLVTKVTFLCFLVLDYELACVCQSLHQREQLYIGQAWPVFRGLPVLSRFRVSQVSRAALQHKFRTW